MISENIFAPLRELDSDQLIELARLPIMMPSFLFELHMEIGRRKISNKDVLLRIVFDNFKKARARELELEIMSMEGRLQRSLDVKNRYQKDRKNSNGTYNYEVVLNYLSHFVLLDNERKNLFPDGDILKHPKQVYAIDLCEKIVAAVKASGRMLTESQKEAIDIAEKIANLKFELPNNGIALGPVDKKTENINNTKKSQRSMSWSDTLKQIRHGRLHPDASRIANSKSSGDWADASPLKMLGYSVNTKDGMPEKDRHEFLIDFCEIADLPKNLPADYVRPWGDANTSARILRTARHLGFVRRNFEKQDSMLYARAIECWRKDFEFLEKIYGGRLTRAEWEQARKGM